MGTEVLNAAWKDLNRARLWF